ncbi:hypothetical protein PCASD_04442 [Puccinia coronata f. sp. avenae]|uniref:Uncharacterized protein n=1 Tax=Puccinia coronata f. sp. avenae TaxID=200324 RepID=A0A2N5VBV3_9BASI|nr:hypothetical protein PCASD_04442 [Puccinia coronata f. sp. avenae]
MARQTGQKTIRIELLSDRVFVAQIRNRGHGSASCEYQHLIVIPTRDDCVGYGLRPSTAREGFYEVAIVPFQSQRQMFRQARPTLPIIRLGIPRHPDGTNDFRRRILNTKHTVWYRSIHGQWCCRDWVLEVLYAELDLDAFPQQRLWKLIDHLEQRRGSSAVLSPSSETNN